MGQYKDVEILDHRFSFNASAVVDVVNESILARTNVVMNVQGDGGPVILHATTPISAGTVGGQLVILEGNSDTNTVEIPVEATGVHLHGRAILSDHDKIVLIWCANDNRWEEVSRNFASFVVPISFNSRVGASGVQWAGGHYEFGGSNFTPSGSPQNLGAANNAQGAHAFVVLGASSVDMVVRVTGTSVTDAGVRTASDTEDIDTSGGSLNDYLETTKKWIGVVAYTLQSGSGIAVNYGFAKYWDNFNVDFRLLGFEATWRGGANDSGADIAVIHHKATGWTYNAGSEPTPPTPLADMNTDYVTEQNVVNNENGAWKRDNLNQAIDGGDGEGIILRITTGASNTFENGNLMLNIRPA